MMAGIYAHLSYFWQDGSISISARHEREKFTWHFANNPTVSPTSQGPAGSGDRGWGTVYPGQAAGNGRPAAGHDRRPRRTHRHQLEFPVDRQSSGRRLRRRTSGGQRRAQSSEAWNCDIGLQIAENLHPCANPAVDSFGNIYTTYSGSRGQKVPVAVYRIDLNFNMRRSSTT